MATQTKTATKAKATAKAVKSIELSEAGVLALAKFNKAKKAEARAKALKAEAQALLEAELGSSTQATVQGVVALKVVAGTNTSFDRELMAEVYPEAFEATLRSTSYTYIKTL